MKHDIMLVSGDHILKRDIRRFFSNSPDVSISIETTDLTKILDLLNNVAQTRTVNVIIFDLDFYKIDEMISFLSECNKVIPHAAKIVCSHGQFIAKPDILNKVLKLGNINFSLKPIDPHSLREIMEMTEVTEKAPQNHGKVLTFLSGSGGTGKTTLLVNLAWTMSRTNPDLRICVMDFNTGFGSVAMNLNLKSTHLNCFESLAREFVAFDIVDEDIFRKHLIEMNNIDVLPSQCTLSEVDSKLHSNAEAIIERAKAFYDFILIDTTTHIEDHLLSAAVNKSDLILDVFTPRVYDIRNTRVMTQLLNDLNIPVAKHLFILNRLGHDDDDRIENIEKLIGSRPLFRIRENFDIVAISADLGILPVVKYPNEAMTRDIQSLAKAVLNDDFTSFLTPKTEAHDLIWKKIASLWGN